jgi:hypothetical protein
MTGRAPLAILFLLLVAGCGVPEILHVDDLAPRPERDPAAVRLFLDAPEDPYRTIAIIRSREPNIFRSVEKLKAEVRAEAARLGADAVILGLAAASDGGGIGTTPEGSIVYVAGSSELRVIGRAIVFTDTRGS